MLFNIDKCKVMHLGYNNCQADYYMDTVQLQKVDEERDLEMLVSNDLKWKNQCIAKVKQALHKSLVRPHLEYCTPIFNPYLIKDIKMIENVSHKAHSGH